MNAFLLSVFATLILLGNRGSAQSVAVRALALRTGEMPEVYLKGTKQIEPLRFSAVQPGEVIPAPAGEFLQLYRRETGEGGEVTFAAAERVKVPGGAKGVLLLGWTAGKESRYAAIEDDFGTAGYDSWLLINTGSRPVALTVGEGGKPHVVEPNGSSIYKIPVPAGEGAEVIAQAPFDGKVKTFYSTYWPVRKGKRSVIIFIEDGERIVVKKISDQLATGKSRKQARDGNG